MDFRIDVLIALVAHGLAVMLPVFTEHAIVMFRSGLLTYMGGNALALSFLVTITALTEFEVGLDEAPCLSALGVVAASYGVTDWRVRRIRSNMTE